MLAYPAFPEFSFGFRSAKFCQVTSIKVPINIVYTFRFKRSFFFRYPEFSGHINGKLDGQSKNLPKMVSTSI